MLPYLKQSKWPRIQPEMEERLVQAPASDHLEEHCAGELMQAVEDKNIKQFREAFEALVMNSVGEYCYGGEVG